MGHNLSPEMSCDLTYEASSAQKLTRPQRLWWLVTLSPLPERTQNHRLPETAGVNVNQVASTVWVPQAPPTSQRMGEFPKSRTSDTAGVPCTQTPPHPPWHPVRDTCVSPQHWRLRRREPGLGRICASRSKVLVPGSHPTGQDRFLAPVGRGS
jgi:hypothetical protein